MQVVAGGNAGGAGGSNGIPSADDLTRRYTVTAQMHINRPETVLMINLDVVACGVVIAGRNHSACPGRHHRPAGAGPLGRPSEFVHMPLDELRKRRYLFVAGGVGTAPIYPQVKWLHEHGVRADVIIGAKNSRMLIYTDAMRAVAENLYIATDDGSEGFKGMVTGMIEELVEQRGERYDECVAIGPMIMMKFVALTTRKYNLKTTVSLNALMVDGTGMCGACRVTVGGKTRFTCVDGPEFDGHEVDFDEAMRRQGMYRTQEQRAAAIEAEREAGHVCRIGLDK